MCSSRKKEKIKSNHVYMYLGELGLLAQVINKDRMS